MDWKVRSKDSGLKIGKSKMGEVTWVICRIPKTALKTRRLIGQTELCAEGKREKSICNQCKSVLWTSHSKSVVKTPAISISRWAQSLSCHGNLMKGIYSLLHRGTIYRRLIWKYFSSAFFYRLPFMCQSIFYGTIEQSMSCQTQRCILHIRPYVHEKVVEKLPAWGPNSRELCRLIPRIGVRPRNPDSPPL